MNAGKPLRLFVAAGIPERHLLWLQERIALLRSSLPAARWTDSASQHLTLKFLGSTPPERLGSIVDALDAVAAGPEPAHVSLTVTGAFPNRRRAHVFWMGLDDPSGLLRRLAADLDRALHPLGYTPEKRAFTPHVTLARLNAPAALPEEASIDGRELPPFVVDRLILWRSRLHPAGARYEEIQAFALRSRSPAPRD